jgi:hypothetical protein
MAAKTKVVSDVVVMKSSDTSPTSLVRLDLRTILVNIEGTSPLITHPWSKRAIYTIQAKQAGKAAKGRALRNPVEEYEESFYRLPDGSPAFPLLSFKNCAVTACTSLGKEITKVAARQFFRVVAEKGCGDLTRIYYPEDCPPRMRTDVIRVGMGAADLRYRPEFAQWGAKLRIQFNARAVSQEQVVNLLNLGGFAVGIGEHRPECNGDKGCFEVVDKFSWE